jgi:hypothetical protein
MDVVKSSRICPVRLKVINLKLNVWGYKARLYRTEVISYGEISKSLLRLEKECISHLPITCAEGYWSAKSIAHIPVPVPKSSTRWGFWRQMQLSTEDHCVIHPVLLLFVVGLEKY